MASANEIIRLNDSARLAYYALPEVYKPVAQNILREVKKLFDETLQQQTSLKYVLFFTHDETLISLLTALGVKLSEPPGFAARVDFSLLSVQGENLVQISYDGNPLHAKYCDARGCNFKEWEQLNKTISK